MNEQEEKLVTIGRQDRKRYKRKIREIGVIAGDLQHFGGDYRVLRARFSYRVPGGADYTVHRFSDRSRLLLL